VVENPTASGRYRKYRPEPAQSDLGRLDLGQLLVLPGR
jgi:hypothetical protein